MRGFLFVLGALISTYSVNSLADVVEFHIANGTGRGAWNTPETPIRAVVGDTIHFINDDQSVTQHQLHTFGSPCPHGTAFRYTQTYDCVVTSAHAASAADLYDHNFGNGSKVYIETVNP